MDRFFQYVKKTNTCWLWRGATTRGRQGVLRRKGKNYPAHAYIYISIYGPLPPRQRLIHTCGNTLCVKPDHLLLAGSLDGFKSYTRENPLTGCWEWQLFRLPGMGYGVTSTGGKGNSGLAHRVAYKKFIGPIPKGACVLHKCDNPPCCNPEHLFLGTKSENNHDRVKKGRTFSKLKGDDVLKIKKHLLGKFSHAKIAKMFGVSRSCINSISRRSNWKSV